ncbi:DUF2846 domain-containing protein [Marinobacter sp. M216]|uniref:DUF2846 domain-containing protein n=1 Tax=Marinobacter albus TaxID=3030833 RepID=A0ABT7HBG1_9GAMM|nr:MULTISPECIES: DUF2846 domain-containing protein [unclassified Marinobacter]MBW7470406.1 DUF2846 domain-containing protein [Marinobacter sp. F4218]MDK9557329.1 DUF2846 domain-containing protein [Marinobacter sp. M216]
MKTQTPPAVSAGISLPALAARVLLASVLLLSSGCTIYQSIGKSVGAFLHPVSGPDFVHIPDDEWDRENALLYFYRTHSQWAADEIESPSVYIDDKHYFNIRNDSYTWLEVSPGERHIAMRRPLLGLEGLNSFSLSLIADAALRVEPGKIYYLRYNELTEPEQAHPDLDPEHPLAQGDLQLVTRRYAMQAGEIVSTRFLNSDLLAPNHAATSIVETNEDMDYERKMVMLEEERELEIERLKEEGKYESASWFWPFGGGPTVPLESEEKMEQLEREYAQLELERERREEAESGGGWWIF